MSVEDMAKQPVHHGSLGEVDGNEDHEGEQTKHAHEGEEDVPVPSGPEMI